MIIFECDDSKTNLVCYERNERHMTSSLYSDCELSLVLSACSRNSAGQNLGTLGNVLSEFCYILVINAFRMLFAENANFLSSLMSNGAGRLLNFFIHDL